MKQVITKTLQVLLIASALVTLVNCAKDKGNSGEGGSTAVTNNVGNCQLINGQYTLNGQPVSPQQCTSGQYTINPQGQCVSTNTGHAVQQDLCYQNQHQNGGCQYANGQYYLNGQVVPAQYCQQQQNQLYHYNQYQQPYYQQQQNNRCQYRNYYGFYYMYCY